MINSKNSTSSVTHRGKKTQKPAYETTSPTVSDMDTEASDTSICQERSGESGLRLKDHYYLSLFICFVGVVSCYSGYAVLQESL